MSSDIFNRWDRDGDSVLNANELTAGMHGTLDRDGDRRIIRYELGDGWNRWGFGTAGVDFDTLDRNRDGYLTEAELDSGLNTAGYYDRWNFGNRGIAQNDFNTGLYDVWDRDRSGILDENEYDGALGWNWF